jgi:hypothetical protein
MTARKARIPVNALRRIAYPAHKIKSNLERALSISLKETPIFCARGAPSIIAKLTADTVVSI